MGQCEYGGNGSVHYYGVHRRDRNHGHQPHSYHEVDECPTPEQGGSFTVQIFGVAEADFTSANGKVTVVSGVLTVVVPIVHGADYTRQILISWPDCDGKSEAIAPKSAGRPTAS
jgi:hypothetical protein